MRETKFEEGVDILFPLADDDPFTRRHQIGQSVGNRVNAVEIVNPAASPVGTALKEAFRVEPYRLVNEIAVLRAVIVGVQNRRTCRGLPGRNWRNRRTRTEIERGQDVGIRTVMRVAVEPDLPRIEFPHREIQILPVMRRTLRPTLATIGPKPLPFERAEDEVGGQR